MTALSCRSVFGAAILLAANLVSAGAAPTFGPTAIVAAPSPAIRLAAMGDLPTVPRRRGGRRSKEKDKPYQPLAKDPKGESAAAHKEYLKRYGF